MVESVESVESVELVESVVKVQVAVRAATRAAARAAARAAVRAAVRTEVIAVDGMARPKAVKVAMGAGVVAVAVWQVPRRVGRSRRSQYQPPRRSQTLILDHHHRTLRPLPVLCFQDTHSSR